MPQGEKRGRQPLNSYQTSYKIQKEAIQWVLKYFYQHDVKDLFKHGVLSYGVVEDTVRIDYIQDGWSKHYMEFKVALWNRRRADELRMLVQDFVVDTYFLYEWDGGPVENIVMGRLFGVTPQDINNIVRKIKDKIKDNKDLLWYE